MNAKELRLGNYVLIDNPKSHPNLLNQPVQVVVIQLRNDISFPNSNASISVEIDIHNGFSQFNEFIKTIPLTEQWLLKCGFSKEDENNFILHQNNIYFRVHRNLISGEFMCKLVNNYSFLIKSVHNLQNLYFSITNVELTVA